MHFDSHTKQTWIATLCEFVDVWRKRDGMSQATVVDLIVRAHDAIGGEANTGIGFVANGDEYNRMKANMDRVFRWLDDKSKDKNLLPANFIPSILSSMPVDIRMACLNKMLSPIGFAVCGITATSGQFNGMHHLVSMTKEHSEAVAALADVIEAPTPAKIDHAIRENADLMEAARLADVALRNARQPA
ncbi:MAG: hypothetical protein ACRYF5_02180 [Janthinobacterium lividum]